MAIVPLLATGCAARADHAVVPVPAEIRVEPEAAFAVDSTSTIGVSGGREAVRIARVLAEVVGTTPKSRPEVVAIEADAAAGVGPVGGADMVLVLDGGARNRHGPEGYALRVSEEGVRIEAAEPAGLFYGVQTLRMLLPPVAEYGAARPSQPLALPYVRIEDRPRFGWRGAMLDVARHFFPVEDVKRYIDLLAMHKMNRLHLHLADDQGWRIEVPAWPALTGIGGSTEVGGGPGGFYTTQDYRDIVAYAADRFITIVPEIDLPGHTNAALASVPELNCDGVAPPLYTGIQVGFSTVCPDREFTYAWVDDVLGHLANLTPGPWLHVGGDEVEELTDAEYRHFIERVERIVHRHGKRMIGWQEIAAAELDSSTRLQYWNASGDALVAGAVPDQVILSPGPRVYIDMKYRESLPIGHRWAGMISLRDAYDWDPVGYVPGLPAEAIAGLEAPLWTEFVASRHDLEFMAFPRIAAVAELAWSPTWATDWDDFRRRIARLGLRWTALGVNFYRTPEVDWEEP
jgi:hexosaminidase